MNSIAVISHAALDQALVALQVGMSASDLHGSLCGYLCVCGTVNSRNWINALVLDKTAIGDFDDRQELLHNLYAVCRAQLDDPDFGFSPLLPELGVPLADRAEALVQWCQGFVGGIGLAGVTAEHGLSSDAADILRDFSTIAASHFEYADVEEDEDALSEVLEFIRVGVLLLHTEWNALPSAESTVH